MDRAVGKDMNKVATLTGPDTTPLVTLLKSAGYPRHDAPLLFPAEVFIELSGEDIRRRLYLTQNAAGQELCLRPEFTIPLCKAVLPQMTAGKVINLSYCGPVFRHRTGESGEFVQAGVESIGREDREAADADLLSLALLSARLMGAADPVIRMGDSSLLSAVLDAIAAPAPFSRRLKRRLAAGVSPDEAIRSASGESTQRYAGVIAAMGGTEPEAARAFVGDMMRIGGFSAAGGRTVDEIAQRFLARTDDAQNTVSSNHKQLISDFLKLTGAPDDVLFKSARMTSLPGLDISETLSAFEQRTGFMAAAEIPLHQITASPGFVRNLEYYSGMVFEIVPEAQPKSRPLIGGGRYDGLMRRLGAPNDIPAVGFAIWVERFGSNA